MKCLLDASALSHEASLLAGANVVSQSGRVKFSPLPRSFYEPSAEAVAPLLLGRWLVRAHGVGFCGGPIVETEAYLVGDPASHGFVGETARTRIMYGPPGFAYVYFIYGNHWCVNAVCQPPGRAEAVLIRAIEPAEGEVWMRRNRPVEDSLELTNGPGKLCAAMKIAKSLDGADLCDPTSALFIAENPDWAAFRRQRGPVITTTRIGLTKAAHHPLRFYLDSSRFVSRRLRPVARPANRKGGASSPARRAR